MSVMRPKIPVLFVVAVLLATTGCPKKNKGESPTTPTNGSSSSGADAPEVRRGLPDANTSSILARVYFSFDSTSLTEKSREELRVIADRMNLDASMTVRLEGHADERGTTQYNLALSDRRASAVASYLFDLGVANVRMTRVGFGEERPMAAGHDEAAWEMNRRVDVLMTSSSERVAGSPQ